jgi:hypothetical protein
MPRKPRPSAPAEQKRDVAIHSAWKAQALAALEGACNDVRYLDFRSTAGADYDAEMWFDQELKQTWRR